jgi:hypothetical protein
MCATSIVTAMMMEAARASETSVYFNETTWRYVQEGCRLQTLRCENLKSHLAKSGTLYQLNNSSMVAVSVLRAETRPVSLT